MLNDTLSNALSKIMNNELRGKKSVTIKPTSKLVKGVLTILNENGYLGEISHEESKMKITAQLMGAINKCGSIKPRFSVKKNDFERFERKFLPAKNFGVLIITTQQGIMTHKQAKNKGIGGKLLAYCY
jgi:small subunit ribosomal protein S8